ncbi:MAG: arylsulfatase [Bacteroidetes bacterium]|nr:MAG: arylsulfatase [Bacteroidota bacterium]
MHTLTFYLAALCLLCGTAGCAPEPAPARPNLLLIVADDLGFTDLGCFGGEIRTPNLDALAREGIRATSFYTAPTCSPSRGMLFSGVDNHRCGYGTMEGDWAENQKGLRGYEGHLNFDVVAFPRLLLHAGYHTAIAGKWHQAYPATEKKLWPDQRGFSRSFCLLQGGAGHFDDMQPLFSFYKNSLYVEDGRYLDQLPPGFYSSDFYTSKIIQYIDESRQLEKPFFAMLSFTAPHWPLQVPDEDIDRYKGRYDAGYEVLAAQRLERAKKLGIIPPHTPLPERSPNVQPWEELSPQAQKRAARNMEIYAAMIERLDANVGRLMQHLKQSGQYENTLIVFMADNGAEGNNVLAIADTEEWVARHFDNSYKNLGRKNSYTFTGPGWAQLSSLPFRWYKTFASEGGVRCPLIIRHPRAVQPPGSIDEQLLSVMDIAPTFLEAAAVKHPGRTYQGRNIYPMDGRSMLAYLRGKAQRVRPQDEAYCWELYGRRGVRKGSWKATWLEPPYGKGAWELFDLSKDPSERRDLAAAQPAKLQELLAEWERYVQTYQLTLPSEPVAYGKETFWREP